MMPGPATHLFEITIYPAGAPSPDTRIDMVTIAYWVDRKLSEMTDTVVEGFPVTLGGFAMLAPNATHLRFRLNVHSESRVTAAGLLSNFVDLMLSEMEAEICSKQIVPEIAELAPRGPIRDMIDRRRFQSDLQALFDHRHPDAPITREELRWIGDLDAGNVLFEGPLTDAPNVILQRRDRKAQTREQALAPKGGD